QAPLVEVVALRRKRFTAKDRARIFAAHNGICHLCGGKIQDNEAWELEHIIAWALTQDDSDENLAPAHDKCHKAKTHKQERAAINKALRHDNKRRGSPPTQKNMQSRGFDDPKKRPLIDESKLPFGIGARGNRSARLRRRLYPRPTLQRRAENFRAGLQLPS